MTKREILKEVATSLYLLLAFGKPEPDIVWRGVDGKILANTQKKAETALRMAEPIIGIMHAKVIQEFLDTREEKFTIPCGIDMVKGDKVRFSENVFDRKNRTARYLGQRTICAEIQDIHQEGRDCLFTLRVISTQGVYPLYTGAEIRRSSQSIRCARRIAWSDEKKRPLSFAPSSLIGQKLHLSIIN